MTDDPMPFTDEEVTAAAAVPMTDEILYHALRIGTQALSEFGHTVMLPVFATQLGLTDRETAVGMTFYRLLAAVHTLSDLRQPYHFQAISGQTERIGRISGLFRGRPAEPGAPSVARVASAVRGPQPGARRHGSFSALQRRRPAHPSRVVRLARSYQVVEAAAACCASRRRPYLRLNQGFVVIAARGDRRAQRTSSV